MPRVVHFEIAADDPERASKFYSEVFGWAIKNWGGPVDYWLASTGSADEQGIDGAITWRQSSPSQAIVNTIAVPSIDDFVKKIEENGGKIVMPKQPIPGVGYHAVCLDTEGNTFGIMQNDTSAR